MSQIAAIQAIMADGKWRTINVIKEALALQGFTTTNERIGAQLRDIRKKSAFVVNTEKIKEGVRGTFQYQVLSAGDQENGPFVTTPADLNVDLDIEDEGNSFDEGNSEGFNTQSVFAGREDRLSDEGCNE